MYIVVEGQARQFKGLFKTSELARLWAEQQPSSHLEVLEVTPNYPEKTQHMFGPFAGNGHRFSQPEVEEDENTEDTETEAAEDTETEAAEDTETEAAEDTETEAAEEPVEEPTEKPKRTRQRISGDRVQECCDTIIDMMEPGEAYKRNFFLEQTDVTGPEWTKVIKVLLDNGQVRQEGVKKGACYYLVTDEVKNTGTEDENTEDENTED